MIEQKVDFTYSKNIKYTVKTDDDNIKIININKGYFEECLKQIEELKESVQKLNDKVEKRRKEIRAEKKKELKAARKKQKQNGSNGQVKAVETKNPQDIKDPEDIEEDLEDIEDIDEEGITEDLNTLEIGVDESDANYDDSHYNKINKQYSSSDEE